MDYSKYITSKETFERIDIEAPMERSKELIKALYGDGWMMVRSGPKTINIMLVDSSIYHVKAERKV